MLEVATLYFRRRMVLWELGEIVHGQDDEALEKKLGSSFQLEALEKLGETNNGLEGLTFLTNHHTFMG